MHVLIVGNNVAGMSAARRIRELDEKAKITVFSQEDSHYYTRPKLIDLIAGKCTEKDLFFYKPEWYEKNRIQVFLGTPVLSINIVDKVVMTKDGFIPYDKLVLATGAESFIPDAFRSISRNIHTLRTLDDATKIKGKALLSKNAVIIGGGVLGLEIASAIRNINSSCDITLLEALPHLLPRQLDEKGSDFLRRILKKIGITPYCGVSDIRPVEENGLLKIKSSAGSVPYDLACISAGVRPKLDLAQKAGINTNRGIVVNDNLETSVPDVYTIGDCAEHKGMVYGIIRPAMEMAAVVAEQIVGNQEAKYMGSTISKTFKILDFYLTSIGDYNPLDDNKTDVIHVQTDDEYRKFVLKKEDSTLIGFIAIAHKQYESKVLRLMASGQDLSGIKEKMYDSNYEF